MIKQLCAGLGLCATLAASSLHAAVIDINFDEAALNPFGTHDPVLFPVVGGFYSATDGVTFSDNGIIASAANSALIGPPSAPNVIFFVDENAPGGIPGVGGPGGITITLDDPNSVFSGVFSGFYTSNGGPGTVSLLGGNVVAPEVLAPTGFSDFQPFSFGIDASDGITMINFDGPANNFGLDSLLFNTELVSAPPPNPGPDPVPAPATLLLLAAGLLGLRKMGRG